MRYLTKEWLKLKDLSNVCATVIEDERAEKYDDKYKLRPAAR